MQSFSIVIVCKDEADIIGKTLQSLQGLTDDILIYDNGSNDGTQDIVRQFRARLLEGPWEGFGKTKARAAGLAKYDWILSLDADEAIDEVLKRSLMDWQPAGETLVYDLAFKNFLGDRHLQYGEWGRDHHIRFFNRKAVNWDEAPVHENLVLPAGTEVRKLKGFVLHRTMKDIKDYAAKIEKYAMLSAEKYQQQGKKNSWFKLRLAPGVNFFSNYVLRLGFLDGQAGYISAKMTAWYTFLKYARLNELNRKKERNGSH